MKHNRLVHVSLACSLALVSACGGSDTAATTDTLAARSDSMGTMSPGMAGTTGTAAGTLGDPSTAAQIDSIATAAGGGLTAVPPALAVSLIRSLEQKLDATEDPALDDIADELEKLREELDGGDINGGDIASILERLGPKVQAVAPRAGAAQAQLTAIAGALTAAVPTLRGGK